MKKTTKQMPKAIAKAKKPTKAAKTAKKSAPGKVFQSGGDMNAMAKALRGEAGYRARKQIRGGRGQ